MKTRNTIIILILAIIVLILTTKYAKLEPNNVTKYSNDSMLNTEGGLSLRDITNSNDSYSCTLIQESENSSMTGTILSKDGKLRGNYVATIAELGGAEINTSIVIRDGSLYTWSSLSPEGTMIALSDTEVSNQQDPAYGFDIKLDYNCVQSDVSSSEFDLPNDIEFKEYVAPPVSTSANVPVEQI